MPFWDMVWPHRFSEKMSKTPLWDWWIITMPPGLHETQKNIARLQGRHGKIEMHSASFP